MLKEGYDHKNERDLTDKEIKALKNNISCLRIRLNKKKRYDRLEKESRAMKKQFDCFVKLLDKEIPEEYKTALELRINSQSLLEKLFASSYSSERFHTTLKKFMGIQWIEEGKSLNIYQTQRIIYNLKLLS